MNEISIEPVPETVLAERNIHSQVEEYLHRTFAHLPEPNRSMVAHLLGNGVMSVVKNGLKPLTEFEQKLSAFDTEL